MTNDLIALARSGSLSRARQVDAVESAAGHYYATPAQVFDDKYKVFVIEDACRAVVPGRILELGYMNDIWTRRLLDFAGSIDIVEGATEHAQRALQDFASDPRVTVVHSLFEDFRPTGQYDTIVMAGVIKHIPDDVGFLRLARSWLAPGGVVLASTPNSRSLHRRLGACMGLEPAPDEHNARDREVFNVHLYDRYKFRALFTEAGYEVVSVKGIFLKILSTEQLMHLGERYDIERILTGLHALGEELQDYAWYLSLVARLPQHNGATSRTAQPE